MIQEEDVDANGSFIDIIQLNDEFIIMCTNGRVYKLHNIDQSKVAEVTNKEHGDFNDSFLVQVALDRVVNNKLQSKVNAFCYVSTMDGDMYIACASDNISFITKDRIEIIQYPKNVIKIKKILNLDNYIVGLTISGSFVEICPYTKTMHAVKGIKEEVIDDLRVLESNNEYIELLVLSPPNEVNTRSMKVLDFPSMKSKNQLTLPGTSWLVSQQKSAINMYFISGTENENNFIQTIEIKSIIETDPIQRFMKFLQRGHYEEAEEFAKQFNLSLEPLHEARVKNSLMTLQGVKPSSKSFIKTFQQLMEQLTLIKDSKFLVSLRINEISDRGSMTTFLEYLLKNIDTNEYQSETNEINELLLRLETIRLIDPNECNMQWQKILYHKDMARVAMDFFKTDVLLSCLIWSRHSSSIIPNLNLDQFHKWLSNIPSTIEPFELIQWLKHFSPCFLQIYPHEMTHLVDMCLDRTRALQFSNSWPEIGLEFINNINNIFNDVKFMFVDVRRSYHNNMEKIQQLIFTLEEMAVLKKSYLLTMTLDDYCKRSIEETAFRLLQRIQMSNLKRMVNDFLYPIFMERGGTPEDTIVKYIQFLCSNKNLGYWQERAVTSIDLLHNEENRLNSALSVLKVSPVPWSDVVLPLAALGTTSSHPLASSIYIEYKTQSIKIIKVKYQWPVDYYDLNQDRVKLVFRIMKIDKPEMIDDIKTLIQSSPEIAIEAYFHLLNHLVEQGRIEEFADLVKNISEDLELSGELFGMVTNAFIRLIDEDDFGDDNQAENFMEALKLMVNLLKTSEDENVFNLNQKTVNNLKNIVKIRRILNFKVNLKHLKSSKTKTEMMEKGITSIATDVDEKKSIDGMWSKIDLLVSTFGFDHLHGYKLLCLKLNNLYVTCHVIDVLCMSTDVVDQKEIESALELVILAIAQQIAYFENNLKPNFDHYDPLTLPIAYEFLVKCLPHFDLFHHRNILQLINWMRIGRYYYPYNVIEATRNERVVDKSIFTSKMSNGNQTNGSRRRETFSIFDEDDFVEVKQVRKF